MGEKLLPAKEESGHADEVDERLRGEKRRGRRRGKSSGERKQVYI